MTVINLNDAPAAAKDDRRYIGVGTDLNSNIVIYEDDGKPVINAVNIAEADLELLIKELWTLVDERDARKTKQAEVAPVAKKPAKAFTISDVHPKPYTRGGVVYGDKVADPETRDVYNVDIVKNESIRIYGVRRNQDSVLNPGTMRYDRIDKVFDITFKVGDKAEYNSYNTPFIGTITAIGEKTVKIAHYEQNTQLDLYTFCWRNYDFNLAQAMDEIANHYD